MLEGRLIWCLLLGLGPNLTPSALSQFMNAKGNVLVALTSSTSASSSIVSLLNELDISLPAERTGLVVDHFNYDVTSAAEKHEVLLLPTPGSSLRAGVRDLFSPAAPNGELIAFPNAVGQTLGSGALLAPILRAPATAYSYNPKEESEVLEDLFASGQQLSLVTTFQARNSARFGIVGSADSLTDKWFDAKVKKVGEKNSVKTVNQEFAKLVSGWVFNEIGVLRVNAIEHHLNETGGDDTSNPKIYRIKNDVVRFHPMIPHANAKALRSPLTYTVPPTRLIPFPFPSTHGTSGRLSPCPPRTSYSSSSACSQPSTASTSPSRRRTNPARLTAPRSSCPISTASSTSLSTTSARTLTILRRRTPSLCATLPTTSGLAVTSSRAPGPGSPVFWPLLLAGSRFVVSGCTASLRAVARRARSCSRCELLYIRGFDRFALVARGNIRANVCMWDMDDGCPCEQTQHAYSIAGQLRIKEMKLGNLQHLRWLVCIKT